MITYTEPVSDLSVPLPDSDEAWELPQPGRFSLTVGLGIGLALSFLLWTGIVYGLKALSSISVQIF